MREWVCLERPNGCHPGSLEGRVSYGRRTACASFLRRTYDVYTSFLWAWCWKTRKCSTRLAAPRPPIHLWEKPCLLPKNFLPSLTPAFILQPHPHHLSPLIIVLQPLYSSSWSSPQCDQHLWMIAADLLLGSELQAMQNQFILLRCHPASRFIIITTIEITIIYITPFKL